MGDTQDGHGFGHEEKDFQDNGAGLLCTCPLEKQTATQWNVGDHDDECDLLCSNAFYMGQEIWSPGLKRLIEAPSPPPGKAHVINEDEYLGMIGSYDKDFGDAYSSPPKSPSWGAPGKFKAANTFVPKPSCAHSQDKFEFSDGSKIYLSSGSQKQRHPKKVPDLHIMLASAQYSVGIAWYVDWVDHGLPQHPDSVVWDMVNATVDMMQAGKMIETGCMAAHGRTGTFVGLLELQILHRMEQPLPAVDTLIAWIRKNHCERAVEGEKQEWYLGYYRSYLLGIECAPLPPVPKYSSGVEVKGGPIKGQLNFKGESFIPEEEKTS